MDTKEALRGKRRGWIKNAAIIFLAIMLVLTFFSNTIMNRSLPEVATQYVSSGTISAKIRGSGTVTANSAYEVKVKENRVIKTVAVRKGDTVEVGDVLFILEEGESTGLQELRDQLDDAKYNYRLLLLSSPYINTSSDSREIERLKEKVEEAIEERDLSYVTDAQIASAESDVTDKEIAAETAANQIEDLDEKIAELNEQLAGLSGGTVNADLSAEQKALDAAERELNSKKTELQTANLIYGRTYEKLSELAATWELEYHPEYSLEARMAGYARMNPTQEVDGTVYDFAQAYETITDAKVALETAQIAYNDAQTAYYNRLAELGASSMESAQASSLKAQLETLEEQKKAAEKEKKNADKALEEANALLETLKTKKENYKMLDDAVKAAEDALEDKLISVQESQHSTTVEKTKFDLDVEKAKKQIDELQEKIDKYEEGEGGDTINAPVAGTVTAINISAGSTTDYDVSLMTIEENDRGYMLSFSVTNEQAQKVKIGDSADVTGYYWGSDIKATLAAITNDPAGAGQSKLLNFVVEGDVSAGDQLNLAISQKSANYELIVPNSAVRSDANGYFVLTVQTKNSPLGNRYVATRVDVQVLASDDTNTAVSGGLVSYDYVITTSSAPLTPGQLVRLVEN